mgnify:CR=1 FL=1
MQVFLRSIGCLYTDGKKRKNKFSQILSQMKTQRLHSHKLSVLQYFGHTESFSLWVLVPLTRLLTTIMVIRTEISALKVFMRSTVKVQILGWGNI